VGNARAVNPLVHGRNLQSGIQLGGSVSEYPLNYSVVFNTDGNYYLEISLIGNTTDFSAITVNKFGGYLVKISN
jgi:hypothetical protein